MRKYIIIILLLALFFQNWLLSVVPFIGNLDEIVTLIALVYYLYNTKPGSYSKMLILSAVIILITLCFNFKYNIQHSRIAIIGDIIGCFKFIIVYLGAQKYVSKNRLPLKSIAKSTGSILLVYLIVLSVFALINLFKGIGMDAGMRYGVRMFSFVYGTPGHLINQMTYLLILAEYLRRIKMRKLANIIAILSLFVLLCTTKTRAFILIATYVSLSVFSLNSEKNRFFKIAVIFLVVVLVGYSQFQFYFMGDESTPRLMFVMGAVQLCTKYFPYGTGFATFGSSAAAQYYSPLYSQVGISERWGMTEDNPLFLNDNYLPMVFVQFGLPLAIIFLFLVAMYCRHLLMIGKKNPTFYRMSFFFVADIVLSSIQSSYLAHYSVVALTVFFVLFNSKGAKCKQVKKKNEITRVPAI